MRTTSIADVNICCFSIAPITFHWRQRTVVNLYRLLLICNVSFGV
jgi:hypothetical protein